jgi:hypothetical protein
MTWITLTKSSQAQPGVRMQCPRNGDMYTVRRRGRVPGRVGILIEFSEGRDIAVVDAKHNWLVESSGV